MTTDSDPRLERFIQQVGRQVVAVPYGSDDDDTIQHFIWILNVPHEKLCEVHDQAIELALDIYEDGPLPFVIGVADPEKTRVLGYPPAVNEPLP